jgi:hypothetical protein
MVTLGPARTTGRPHQGYHDVAQSPQGVAVIVAETTIFSKQRRYSQSNGSLETTLLQTTTFSKT